MTDSAPACRSSRCRHRGDCARNPVAPGTGAAAPGTVAGRPRCFEPPRIGEPPAPLGRTAD